MNFKWPLFVCFLKAAIAQDPGCDFYQSVNPNSTYEISSPGYPRLYKGGLKCRWIADCPPGYNCRLSCPMINIPQSNSCMKDQFLISRTGDPGLNGADKYCGRGSLTITSTGQRLSIGLITAVDTRGGRFICSLNAQPSIPTEQCSCGARRQNRIVGGQETGVNEFPMMVGLVDVRIAQIKCGAVIISKNYVLTAAHCVNNMKINETAVVVGEHNVETGDSPATKAYRVASFRIHPAFSQSNYDYDIAIIRVTDPIEFNDRVGPVCLPFKFAQNNFNGSKVTILGWGTLFPGGPDSKVLQKVDVDVISQNECLTYEARVTPRQLCTLTSGKDACQDDSGGPLLYTDPATSLLYSVGIVSFGRFCASRSPGINTRVTALLDWIVATAPENYCRK